MGDRVVVDIKHKDKTIANGYFHWHGTTLLSTHICCDVVDYYVSHINDSTAPVLKALRAFEACGAELYTESNFSSKDFKYFTTLYPGYPIAHREPGPFGIAGPIGEVHLEPSEIEECQTYGDAEYITITLPEELTDFCDIRISFPVFNVYDDEEEAREYLGSSVNILEWPNFSPYDTDIAGLENFVDTLCNGNCILTADKEYVSELG